MLATVWAAAREQQPLDALARQILANADILQARGEDAGPERTTANGTWPIFRDAMAWDASNLDAISSAWCLFRRHLQPSDCRTLADSQVANQSAQIRRVLQDGVASSAWAVAHPGTRLQGRRPEVGPGSAAPSRRSGGYLISNRTGKPVFVSGFNFAPARSPALDALGVGQGGAFLSVSKFLGAGPTPSAEQVAELADGLVVASEQSNSVTAFVDQAQPLPTWAEAKFPGINDCVPPLCRAHFMGYDMFNPGAEQVVGGALSAAVATSVANATGRLGGAAPVGSWLLANEPCVEAVNSSAAQSAYRAYLRGLYGGSVEALNRAYGTTYTSFDDASVTPTPAQPMSVTEAGAGNQTNLRAARRFREWQVLTSSALLGLYRGLADGVHKAEGAAGQGSALTHLKVAANHIARGPHACSLDLVGLLDDHGIAGTDSRAGPGTVEVFPRPRPFLPGVYSGFYLSQLVYMPFARSVAPSSPVFDSETHEVSTTHWRGAMPRGYVRMFQWLSILLGRSMAVEWYWGRDASGGLVTKAGRAESAPDSMLTQPFALDEQARTLWEATALATSVASLVSDGARPTAVWYSGLSMTMDPAAAPSLVRAAEVGTFLPLGGQVAFVAEQLTFRPNASSAPGAFSAGDVAARAVAHAAGTVAGRGFATGGRLSDDVKTVLLPLAPFAFDAAVASLKAWLAGGPTRRIIVMAANCSSGTSASDCPVLRFRQDGSARTDPELAWLLGGGPQVRFVAVSDAQAMLSATSAAVTAASGNDARAACTSAGEPLLGLACWLSPDGVMFAVNLRRGPVSFDVSLGGSPLTSARSLLAEPPFGVDASSLPRLKLAPFEVAALRV